jgi:hypothetical protein
MSNIATSFASLARNSLYVFARSNTKAPAIQGASHDRCHTALESLERFLYESHARTVANQFCSSQSEAGPLLHGRAAEMPVGLQHVIVLLLFAKEGAESPL